MRKRISYIEKLVFIIAAVCLTTEAGFPQTAAAQTLIPELPPITQAVVVDEQVITSTPVLKIVQAVTTAYSSTSDQTDDTPFITANGTHVRDGIVAANWLPFGAQVRIPDYFGDKVFVVTDRMHRRHAERLDIWMPTREAALKWGIRNVRVEVL